eukprot:COSAG02_NODE_7020_length_3224_cov_4.448992_1_plen_67_part_00
MLHVFTHVLNLCGWLDGAPSRCWPAGRRRRPSARCGGEADMVEMDGSPMGVTAGCVAVGLAPCDLR